MQTRPMCIANSSDQHHIFLGENVYWMRCNSYQEEWTNANLSIEYCKFMQPTQQIYFWGNLDKNKEILVGIIFLSLS